MLVYFPRLVLGLATWLVSLGAAYGQGTDGQVATTKMPPPNSGRVGFGGRADSVRQAFIAASGYRHEFDDFYSAAGRWVVLMLTFGDREGDSRYYWQSCPAFDSVSFQNDFPYWHDRSQVMYPGFYNPHQQLVPMPEADPVTFHGLRTLGLAVDKNHVYQNAWFFDDLDPATLHVYTPGGERRNYPNPGDDAYLISGTVIYPPGWDGPLTAEQVRTFVLPAGYQQVYPPLPAAPTHPSSPR